MGKGSVILPMSSGGSGGTGIKFVNIWSGQTQSFDSGGVDEGGLFQSGYFDDWENDNPAVIAELDPSAGANYWNTLTTALTVNGVSSTRRFVDINGTNVWTATNNGNLAVIDKLTATMFLINVIDITNRQWQDTINVVEAYSVVINGVTYNDWHLTPYGLFCRVCGDQVSDGATVIDGFTILNFSAQRTSSTTQRGSTINILQPGTGSKTKTGNHRPYAFRKCHNLISI